MEQNETTADANYTVGERVRVYSFGHWYGGTVDKVTAKRVFVTYTTGTGTTRTKPYSMTDKRVRKADAPLTTPPYRGGKARL